MPDCTVCFKKVNDGIFVSLSYPGDGEPFMGRFICKDCAESVRQVLAPRLRECPMCGGPAAVFEYDQDGKKFFGIRCQKCYVCCAPEYREQSDAVAAWNLRVEI